VDKLREHTCDQYKLLEIGEAIKIKYIKLQVGVLSANPAFRVIMSDKDRQQFLQNFKSCGTEPFRADSYIEPAKLLHKGSQRVRVVYGHAGMGKTTLLRHVCRALTKGEADTDYLLILFFPLRERLVSQAKTLEDLLSYYGIEDKKMDHSAVAQSLIDNKGCNTLFVFDGADEVRDLLESENVSAFKRIISGQVLPEADVIVTSRPGGIPNLQKLHPSFYEILGFDEKSIDEYISEFFQKDSGEGMKMLNQLHSRPDLIGGAHIPMNLFVLCSIYQGGGFPATITLCYEKFTCQVVAKNSKKLNYRTSSFWHLPRDIKQIIESLGYLAYHGITHSPPIFVFNEDDVYGAFSNILTADEPMNEAFFRGLLHQHSSRIGFLSSSTYNFSHRTNEEFFAAYHLTTCSEDMQLQFLQENIFNPKFSMVVRFFAGLTGLSSVKIVSYLCQPDLKSPLHSIPFNFAERCHYQNPHLLLLLHALYESQNLLVVENIATQMSHSLSFQLSLAPHDLLALRYTLSRCTHLDTLRFHSCEIPSLSEIMPILQANHMLQALTLSLTSLSLEGELNDQCVVHYYNYAI
jgi:hypothetical protein